MKSKKKKHVTPVNQKIVIRKREKSFTGCFTCREKSRKCDEQRPECDNCKRNGLFCKGYDVILVWDHKKADNLRRLKVYHHLNYRSFRTDDVDAKLEKIDQSVEAYDYREVVDAPFTVFDSNSAIRYYIDEIVNQFQMQWYKKLVLKNLKSDIVMDSILASTIYFRRNGNNNIKAEQLKARIYETFEDSMDFEETMARQWIIAMLNLLLTSDLVPECTVDYFDTIYKINQLLPKLDRNSDEYCNIEDLIKFLSSLKFIKPSSASMSFDLAPFGIKRNMWKCWFQVLSLSSMQDLEFFQLENKLWFKKEKLLLSAKDPNYDMSYVWYVAIYIYFIRKFYHKHHGKVSVNYLINEVMPHLANLQQQKKTTLGLRWCLFIICNECQQRSECDEILSRCANSVPLLQEEEKQNWVQYIESSKSLIF